MMKNVAPIISTTCRGIQHVLFFLLLVSFFLLPMSTVYSKLGLSAEFIETKYLFLLFSLLLVLVVTHLVGKFYQFIREGWDSRGRFPLLAEAQVSGYSS